MRQRHLCTDFDALYQLLGDDTVLHAAFDLADHVHVDQTRSLASGTVPYIVHPLFVFFLLRSWGVTDRTTLVAALLHDTVEDQPEKVWRFAVSGDEVDAPATARERALLGVALRFGDDVAAVVDGLSNRDDVPYIEHVFLATEDDRVLAVKLADFTHNAVMLDPGHPRHAKLQAKYAPLYPVLAQRLANSEMAQRLIPAWRGVLASLS